jgi:uncharacterized protein (DUF2249 family)
MKCFFTLLLLFIQCNIFSQTVSLEWVKTFGADSTISDVSGNKTLIDLQGNLFVIGEFSNTVDFNPSINVFNLTSNGAKDIYIQKLDSNGNFLWAKYFGGLGIETFADAALDNLGNLVIVGVFTQSVDFNPGIGVDTKTSMGAKDFFVLKLDNNGNYAWSHTFGSALTDVVRKLCLNSANDIILGGYFHNTIDFDPGISIFNRTAISYDIYLLKLNAQGDFIWVKTLEGSTAANGDLNGLAIDVNENFYIGGTFKDTVDFDPDIPYNPQVSLVPNAYSFFILKLNNSGQFEWVKITNIPSCQTITADNFGHLFIGGAFSGIVDFDPSPNVYNVSTLSYAAYVLKLDTNGNFIWVKKIGGVNAPLEVDMVYDIKCNAQGDIALCGEFAGLEDFNPNAGIYLLGPGNLFGSNNAFYMQLDNNGNFKWAAAIGDNTTLANAKSLAQTNQGKIYIVGSFDGITDFDHNAGVQMISSNGGYHAFLIKLKPCIPSSSIDVINACAPITWINGNTYTTSNFSAKDTFSNANGCDSIVTLNFTLTPLDTTLQVINNTIMSNATGVTYQWVDCKNNNFQQIIGATNQTYIPLISSSYAVIISNGTCTDTSICLPFVVSALDMNNKIQCSLHPNPTHDKISILLPDVEDEIMLEVIGLEGAIIQTQKYHLQKEITIDLRNHSNGMYFIKLISPQWQEVFKVLKY